MEKVGWQVYYQWAEKIARRDDSWGQAACFFSEQSLFLQGVPVLWESSAADPPQRWTAPDCLIFNAYWTYWLWLLQFSLLITILGVLAEVSSGLRTAGAVKLHIDIDRSYSRAACFNASGQFCACLIYFYILKKKKKSVILPLHKRAPGAILLDQSCGSWWSLIHSGQRWCSL